MATRKSTPKAGTKASIEAATKAKGPSKPQAVADELDLDNTVDDEALKPQPRKSKWIVLLDKLYDATVAGKVPRSEDGNLKFVKLGAFTNVNGARTQARAMASKGLDATYEFKSISRDGGSELWGRVIEVEA
jgi:hypothetical protein